MSEHTEQTTFFQILALRSVKYPELKWIHSIPNASGVGGTHGARLGAQFKREGRKAGVWDVFVPLPRGEYKGAYIEFKFNKNKLSPEQIEFGEFIEKQGFFRGVAYTAEQGLEILENYTGWKLR